MPQLFYAGEIIYGGFSAAVSNIDGNILLFAAAGNGVKVARVAPSEYTDRTQVCKVLETVSVYQYVWTDLIYLLVVHLLDWYDMVSDPSFS